MARSDAPQTLSAVLAPAVEQAGLELESVEITPAGKRRVVRVVVDADGGVSLDALADASQSVSTALDASVEADRALGGAPYVLEVTSPGVDRPLTEPRHWRRARGRLVRATLAGGGQIEGRIVGTDDAGVTLDEAGSTRFIAWAELLRGRVQVEFSRPDETGDDGKTGDGARKE